MEIVEKLMVLGLSAAAACRTAGVPYDHYKRWKKRRDAGLALIGKPGPGPTVPLNMDELEEALLELVHCRKRSHGATALYERFAKKITRRELAEVVKARREEHNQNKLLRLWHLEWHANAYIWATDTTEVKIDGKKIRIQTTRDLASRYTFVHIFDHVPTDEEIAQILAELFKKHGAPLFLKRDNGSNENGPAVADVLARHWVFPLNSPVAYPQYNGAVEHAQDEIQRQLAAMNLPATCAFEHAAAYIRLAVHDLNHNPRPILGGKCACNVFQPGRKRAMLNVRQRKEVGTEISDHAVAILDEIEDRTKADSKQAWRLAVEGWLIETGNVVVKNWEQLPTLQLAIGA